MGEYFLPNSVASAAAFDQISISTPNRVVFAVPTRDLVTVSEVNFALKGLIALNKRPSPAAGEVV